MSKKKILRKRKRVQMKEFSSDSDSDFDFDCVPVKKKRKLEREDSDYIPPVQSDSDDSESESDSDESNSNDEMEWNVNDDPNDFDYVPPNTHDNLNPSDQESEDFSDIEEMISHSYNDSLTNENEFVVKVLKNTSKWLTSGEIRTSLSNDEEFINIYGIPTCTNIGNILKGMYESNEIERDNYKDDGRKKKGAKPKYIYGLKQIEEDEHYKEIISDFESELLDYEDEKFNSNHSINHLLNSQNDTHNKSDSNDNNNNGIINLNKISDNNNNNNNEVNDNDNDIGNIQKMKIIFYLPNDLECIHEFMEELNFKIIRNITDVLICILDDTLCEYIRKDKNVNVFNCSEYFELVYSTIETKNQHKKVIKSLHELKRIVLDQTKCIHLHMRDLSMDAERKTNLNGNEYVKIRIGESKKQRFIDKSNVKNLTELKQKIMRNDFYRELLDKKKKINYENILSKVVLRDGNSCEIFNINELNEEDVYNICVM